VNRKERKDAENAKEKIMNDIQGLRAQVCLIARLGLPQEQGCVLCVLCGLIGDAPFS